MDLNNEIDNFARLIEVASKGLYASYSLDNKLGNIRASVFNNAKIYDDKIKPISRIIIKHIKDFCSKIRSLELRDFHNIIEDAKSNQQFCAFILSFHEEILREFKESRDKMEDELMSIRVASLKIESQTNCKTNVTEQKLSTNESGCPILGPIWESILKYIESLKIISGFFSVLHSDLCLFNDRIEQAIEYISSRDVNSSYIHKTIINKADFIIDSCSKYLAIDSNLSNLNNINNIDPNLKNKLDEFGDLLKGMNNSQINSIFNYLE